MSSPAAVRAIRSGGVARGEVTPPPSKSVSHRVLALALLAGRPIRIDDLLVAEDTDLFLDVLRALGWQVDRRGSGVALEPPAMRQGRTAELHCGNAGTLFRFLVALLCTEPGRFVVDGSPRLRQRPVGALVSALRALGAEIVERGEPGCAPLEIVGGGLVGGHCRLDAGESSQYLSALLLAGVRAREPVIIEVERLTSVPYVAVTRREMERFGLGGAVDLPERPEGTYRVRPVGAFGRPRVRVEADWSAAAYPAAAAALTGGDVVVRGVERDSAQGDRRFLDLLSGIGAELEWQEGAVRVIGGERRGLGIVDLGDLPDQVPTLAALAPFCRGTTRIVGVPHLRIKESDRLHAMASELARLGASVGERPDGLELDGVWAERCDLDDRVEVESWNDHRIAMSLALVGLRRPGVVIREPEVVAKSYPGFWDDFERLMMG